MIKEIILTGPKHSGKTCVGKILASLCSCAFIDIDEFILKRTGKSPRQLFNENPDVFKKAEAEAIAALAGASGQERRVIAAGGGIIDNHKAVGILKNSGFVIVYLNISVAAAWERIIASGDLPPFLKTENPQETHCLLHERRSAAYLQLAEIVIEAEGKTPQEIAGEIYKIVSHTKI